MLGVDQLLDFDFGMLLALMQRPTHPDLNTPEFRQSEERVKSLLGVNPPQAPKIESSTPNLQPSPPVAFFDPEGPPRIYSDTSPPPRSTVFEIPGTRLAHGAIGGINGMGNNLDEAKANGQYLAQLSQHHHIEWTHNCSHSIPIDVIETIVLNYQGFSAPAKLLKENWEKFHEAHKNNPNAKYLQFCHSQGALHVRNALLNAPKEIRDRVIVVAIAPAAIVPRNLCFDSFNYASKGDPIPFMETAWQIGWDTPPVHTIAMIAQEAFKELVLLDPHPSVSGIDHDFKSPTFREIIKRHLEQHIKYYGPPK